jgi:hypothetical protein
VSANLKAAEEFVQNLVTMQRLMDLFRSNVFWGGKNANHPRGESITGIETNEGQTDSFAMWKCKWVLRSID